MNDSVTSTPYESLDTSLEADDFNAVVDGLLGGAGTATSYDEKRDEAKGCLQDDKQNSAEENYKEKDVTRDTNSPNVDIRRHTNSPNVNAQRNTTSPNVNAQRNTNSPNVNAQRNTNSPNVNAQRNTNSPNVNAQRNTNSPNGQEARANTSNSSQNSANTTGNPGQRNQQANKKVAKHPDYSDELKRRGTFRNWPARMQQSPEMMSGAGFFFS
ncbi:sporozoite surface protein 2-like, partial [Pecten maximus]|uniref:sporozoite surface protein 2-like n=1 Tax=Pecten maximus TaxID=6579 RepID=UPI0014584CF3